MRLLPRALLLLLVAAGPLAAASLQPPLDLRTEYASDPIGLDVAHPRFSWKLTSTRQGDRQTAYRILVASSPARLEEGQADLWDSGRVASDQSIQVPYAGSALASRQRCFWSVRAWDAQGQATDYSRAASWEMGLLEPGDWQAIWLGYPPGWNGRALYFRRDFDVAKPVDHARLYAAGLGYHEAHLNGAQVGDHLLDPGFTDYSKRVLYATHDVTKLLHPGHNVLGAIVGNGWYGMPKLLLQLEITYADGSRQIVATQPMLVSEPERWWVTSGPITRNSVFDGETYDARLEKRDWDAVTPTPHRNPANRLEAWAIGVPVDAPPGRLVSQYEEPIRTVALLPCASCREAKPGVFVFDVGQNVAGFAELHVSGPRGATVTLRYAESLEPDGTVNQANLRSADCTDRYILKGGGAESWHPIFTYHGFRYVQVEGFPGRPTTAALSIHRLRSSVEPNGTFACSSELLNRIQRLVANTEANNLFSVPTDCPQRNERMGWMNDLTVRLEESMDNFELARFYTKFLNDVGDTQEKDGSITDTAPFEWGRRPADPVCASYVLLGWFLYQYYGDTRALSQHYDGFKAWVEFLRQHSEDGIVNYGSYGDWSPPAAESVGTSAQSKNTPLILMSTGYYYYCSKLVSQMARVLGRAEDERHYREQADGIAAAFQRRFWNDAVGGYASGNQACNAFALFLGIVPPDRTARVLDSLVQDVRRHGDHLTTGNLATKYLLETLSDHGRGDVAFRIASQETYPSWGYMLSHGATTLWERWELLVQTGMNSHDHPMMGSVSSWFYKDLAGIQPDPIEPGFRHFDLRPQFPDGLNWVRASYRTMYGDIRSEWSRRDGTVTVRAHVPVNTRATLHLPSGPVELGSGDHAFTVH